MRALKGFTVTDQGNTVTVAKVRTGKGHRIRVRAPEHGSAIALDALALESLTWQDEPVFAGPEVPADRQPAGRDGQRAHDDYGEHASELRLSSEFADVSVSRASLTDGDGVAVASEKLGYEVGLDAEQLVRLTLQDHDVFSAFLGQPFGPV